MEARVACLRPFNRAFQAGMLALLLVLLAACSNPVGSTPAQKVPFDLQTVLPKDWTPVGLLTEINIDGDADMEWLLFFRYNTIQSGDKSLGPIGGVVFDPQKTGPSATVVLKPYMLLPDNSAGKGQGYLGEREVQVRTYDGMDESGNKTTELAVFGYGAESMFPTRLAIFRWDKGQQLYQLVAPSPFVGDAGIDVDAPANKASPITRVVVKRRTNDRSMLSEDVVYRRQAQGFQKQENEYALGFTYGIPENPFYPEAAVLAYQQLLNKGEWDKAQALLLSEQDRQQLQPGTFQAQSASPGAGPAPGGLVLPSYRGPAYVRTLAYDPLSQEIRSQAAPSGAGTVAPGFPYNMTVVTVTAEVFNEGILTTQTWHLVNAPSASCKGTACWRIVGQR